jgi:hypothetical protein
MHQCSKHDIISLIDKYVNLEESNEEFEAVEVSEKVLYGLFARLKDLIKLDNSDSLDPAHARKATNLFVKMDAYIRSLNAMGKFPGRVF